MEGKSQASTRAFTAAEKERTKPNSIFLSTTDRFNQLETNNPNVRLLSHQQQRRLAASEDSRFYNSLFKGKQNVVRAEDKI